MGRHAIPIELRILLDDIRRARVTELAIDSGFLKFAPQSVGLAKVMRIAELTDEIGGSQERTVFVCRGVGR